MRSFFAYKRGQIILKKTSLIGMKMRIRPDDVGRGLLFRPRETHRFLVEREARSKEATGALASARVVTVAALGAGVFFGEIAKATTTRRPIAQTRMVR